MEYSARLASRATTACATATALTASVQRYAALRTHACHCAAHGACPVRPCRVRALQVQACVRQRAWRTDGSRAASRKYALAGVYTGSLAATSSSCLQQWHFSESAQSGILFEHVQADISGLFTHSNANTVFKHSQRKHNVQTAHLADAGDARDATLCIPSLSLSLSLAHTHTHTHTHTHMTGQAGDATPGCAYERRYGHVTILAAPAPGTTTRLQFTVLSPKGQVCERKREQARAAERARERARARERQGARA